MDLTGFRVTNLQWLDPMHFKLAHIRSVYAPFKEPFPTARAETGKASGLDDQRSYPDNLVEFAAACDGFHCCF